MLAAPTALMDRIYRRQRHIYDLTRKYYLLGRDRLIDGSTPPAGGRVLEIGCGTARNLIAGGARAIRSAQFFGIDISAEMLETARRHGRSRRARRRASALARADATASIPQRCSACRGFARIFISYSLSMIPGWQAALDRGAALAGAGRLAAYRRFRRAGALPGWFRAGLRRWLARCSMSRRATRWKPSSTLLGRPRRQRSTVFERPLWRLRPVRGISPWSGRHNDLAWPTRHWQGHEADATGRQRCVGSTPR